MTMLRLPYGCGPVEIVPVEAVVSRRHRLLVNPKELGPSSDQRELSARSDRSLLRRFRRGEQDAATALYVRYAKRLAALTDAQTAKDLTVQVDPEGIVQSVFRTFFRRAAEGQYNIPDGEELWKLFLVMALNKIRARAKHHRATKRDVGRTSRISSMDQLCSDRDNEALSVLRMTVDELLETLVPVERQMVLMRIEGHGVAQIATRTNRSKRSVERLLQVFRRRVATAISEDS